MKGVALKLVPVVSLLLSPPDKVAHVRAYHAKNNRLYYRRLPTDEYLVYSAPSNSFMVWLGFKLIYGTAAPGFSYWGFELPDWFLAVILAAIGLFTWRKIALKQHRRTHGLCLSCGYDLRATPERCPECGAMRAELDQRLDRLKRTGSVGATWDEVKKRLKDKAL